MFAYFIRRMALIIPTLLGIMVLNFFIVQIAPGGPVEQVIAQLSGTAIDATARISGSQMGETGAPGQATGAAQGDLSSKYRGARGLDPQLIEQLEKQFGFDKPIGERFLLMMENYVQFDFGDSFFQDRSVVALVVDRLPISISLGLWTTLIAYLISIPLGIAKAVRDGSRFDVWTSGAIFVGYAIPGFLFAVLLVVLFSGGNFLNWFPLRGLVSSDWETLSLGGKIIDYLWHLVLPITAMAIGGFATLTMLTKNSFLEEINKQYVITARAKGLSEGRVMYGHVFRNAMLIVVAGFPSAFIGILFTGSLLIEIIFSINGLGLLGYEALIGRDYPIIFGTLFFFTLVGLVVNLLGDMMYVVIDPRIDFERREV
ncbi:MAG: microcin C ABC transporter permease YejB [Rhodospirillaceae bacterium]|jgi:microcin C transport system permease protein|nr:microcin C ABC transporter permease YejB [Rhodospirillaceae bacterium]MBT5675473.1 microcin C ABC transporter permease YejB [Rhodospirillaceae bacterium]MBT5780707.1 microcin C ABC transporter permease YejB [Rhodospirillaceae bacterium]MBT6828869.1 microcin C ABC transporter permease YejB [Rhodospirillaceae bacterium]